jgi:hypothetical protein
MPSTFLPHAALLLWPCSSDDLPYNIRTHVEVESVVCDGKMLDASQQRAY